MSIGGNTCALLQVKGTGAKNSIGAFESEWLSSIPLIGWLDLSAGDSKHSTFNAKIQEGLFIKQTKRYKYTVNHTKKVYYSLEETVASGIAVPDSQREIACRDTFSFSAKSSCDIPLDFLNPIILSDSFI